MLDALQIARHDLYSLGRSRALVLLKDPRVMTLDLLVY